MGTPPKSHPAPTQVTVKTQAPPKAAEVRKAPAKKINCFVMDKPEKPGLIAVSTDRIQDGCFVLEFQPKTITWLVSDGVQWYALAGKMLKTNLMFSGVFAFLILVVLVLNRVR